MLHKGVHWASNLPRRFTEASTWSPYWYLPILRVWQIVVYLYKCYPRNLICFAQLCLVWVTGNGTALNRICYRRQVYATLQELEHRGEHLAPLTYEGLAIPYDVVINLSWSSS